MFISVSNCGGQLLTTPLPQYVALPSPFPDYQILCRWNISAANQLSRLSITIDDNTPSSEQGPNCNQMLVFIFPGKQFVFSYLKFVLQYNIIAV